MKRRPCAIAGSHQIVSRCSVNSMPATVTFRELRKPPGLWLLEGCSGHSLCSSAAVSLIQSMMARCAAAMLRGLLLSLGLIANRR
jgi:hypothetical protein